MQRPSDILVKELLCYKRGAANMWPEYPLDFSTELGDIGWIGRDGQFIHFFNCIEDGHRNVHGLPPDFVPFTPPDDYVKTIETDLQPGEILCSPGATITETESPSRTAAEPSVVPPCNLSDSESPHGMVPHYPITVQLPREKGAFMMSHFPGRRRYMECDDLIHSYIITHRESWFRFSVRKHNVLHRDDFIFISGQVETRQWALGVSQEKNSQFTLEGDFDDDAMYFDNTASNDSCDARAGPERPYMRESLGDMMQTNPLQDQSIFLSFFKARTRIFGTKISATAGPHNLPHNDDHKRSPNMTSFIDPALEYILEVSDCEVAIVGDIEIYRLLGDRSWPDNLLEFLHNLSPKIICSTVAGVYYGRFAHDREKENNKRGNANGRGVEKPIDSLYCDFPVERTPASFILNTRDSLVSPVPDGIPVH